ncbi:MAG: lamin tail domain-containing protein [Bacteroidaceae bacterium]|nr:lamin tail domain-containing protein [Bacteroidaceae bacterium]
MKKFHLGILLSILSFVGLTSCNENVDDTSKVVLNEVLTVNESNFQDDYGLQNAWIEVFNKSFGTVDIAGYQLRVSSKEGDTVTYRIPKGDVLTKIKPRQHALFWADGEPNRGTFHTTCTLDTIRTNWIGLYDNGGKLIDQIEVPALEADHSYARVDDAANEWVVKGGDKANSYVTPSTNNMTIEKNAKQEKFAEADASGVGMAITAMLVVFSGLIVLYISFRLLGLGMQSKKAEAPKQEAKTESTPAPKGDSKEGEIYAAIAMALHEELGNVHDIESGILTLYPRDSQWNAKHLLLRK